MRDDSHPHSAFSRSLGRRRFIARAGAATTGLALFGRIDTVSGRTPIPLVSTRGHFDADGALADDHTLTDYDTKGAVPGIEDDCVSDLTVFVGGWYPDAGTDGDPDAAMLEDVLRAERNLRIGGYRGTVIGFTWDATFDGGDAGWSRVTRVADRNGPKLAAYLGDYLDTCSGNVRLIAHSLGARPVFDALDTLATNGDRPLASVHLLGAAVDDERPTDRGVSYESIENGVGATFNYFSRTDAVLGWAYPPFEADRALGQYGVEESPAVPHTYFDVNVTNQVGSDHTEYVKHVSDDVLTHMRLADSDPTPDAHS